MSEVFLPPPPALTYRELISKKPEELAKEIESIFLKEFLRNALKPSEEKSFTYEVYLDTFAQALARHIALSGGIGLANFILKGL
ncbi:MAG: hypothetical protein GXO04_04470 [Aquificae bacterium]|nr:hypothetical protein [Aquificota bacterium]